MNDNNKLPKQAKPQEFELVQLLFREYISSHIAKPDIEYSFQARFQSFVNQIPSYLHSSSKPGFFTHFFFGSFTSLLDTKLAEKLGIKKLHFNFDRVDHLRIVAETDDRIHVFIFTENNQNKKQNKNKDIDCTKSELRTLIGREYIDDDSKKLEISVIQINKSSGRINVTVKKTDIQDGIGSIKQYNEITKRCVDEDGQYISLENEILKLSIGKTDKSESALKFILKYTKKIHDHYKGLPYGDKAQEADKHGFVAGIFNNFRYRENAHVYLEQFAGRGYADIVLLVRGADRVTKSIPIIIELKAGTGIGTTSKEALTQVEEYTKGFQPNNMRVLTLADNILCVGMNLDHDVNSFMQMQLVQRNQEIIPLIQAILDAIKKIKINNQDSIKQEIQDQLENTYKTFPGVGEKSSAHYYSRFIIGESLLLQDYDKHIFVYDMDEYIATKTIIDAHQTRGKNSDNSSKKQKIEKIIDDSNAVTSVLFIPISNSKDPAIILNIIDANREIELKSIPLDNALIDNRKIVELNIKFNINKFSKSFKEYGDIALLQIYSSVLEYNSAKGSEKVNGNFIRIDAKVSDNLIDNIHDTIDSQKGLIISERKYKALFAKIGAVIYPVKSLINRESEFQGILEGIFKYYSDTKLSEKQDRRALVLTEFQTGGGGRIDMIIQAIGQDEQGTKEYTPIGLELKYDNSVKLRQSEEDTNAEKQKILLSEKQKKIVENLLYTQTERYAQGAAIKSITDSNKVAIMGIVFNKQAKDHNSLLLTTEKFFKANIVHSSKLYSISDINDRDKIAPILEVLDNSIEINYDNMVDKVKIERLIKLLNSNKNLTKVTIINSDITFEAFQMLCNELAGNKVVTSLDLTNAHINTAKAKLLDNLLRNNKHIIHLSINNNNIDIDTRKAINELLQHNKIINKKVRSKFPSYKIHNVDEDQGLFLPSWVDIKQNQMRDSDIIINNHQDLDNFLRRLALDSKYLDLSNTQLTNAMMVRVTQFLSQHQNIDYLDLSYNNITAEGIIPLFNFLTRGSHKISFLDMTSNDIGADTSIWLLAKFIGKNNDFNSAVLKFLNIEDIGITIKECKIILQYLQENTSIEHFNISHNNLLNISDKDDMQSIANMMAYIIYNHPALKTLNLRSTGLNDKVLQSIIKEYAQNPKMRENISVITDLNIADNHITRDGIAALSKLIVSIQKLDALDISNNMIGYDIEKLLILLKDTSITKLSMSNIELNDDENNAGIITGMLDQLLSTSSISALDISNNNIGTEAIEAMFLAIADREEKILIHLNLSGNEVVINEEHQVVDAISRAIRGNRVLQSLDISYMNINDLHLEVLVQSLSESNIVHLNIAGNNIGEYTISALSDLLSQNPPLRLLNISGDPDDQYKTIIDSDNIQDLCNALVKNTILTHLDISFYNIDYDSINILAQYLQQDISLEYLSLANNNLDEAAISALFQGLNTNTHLQYLDIRNNEINSDSVGHIIECLKINKSLQVLHISAGQLSNNIISQLQDESLGDRIVIDILSQSEQYSILTACLPETSRAKRSTNECKIGWGDIDEISNSRTRNIDELVIDSKKFLEYSKQHIADEVKSLQLVRLAEEVKNKGYEKIVGNDQGLVEKIIKAGGYKHYTQQERIKERINYIGSYIINRDSDSISPELKLKLINVAGKMQLIHGIYSTIVSCQDGSTSSCALSVSGIGYAFLSQPIENMLVKVAPKMVENTISVTSKLAPRVLSYDTKFILQQALGVKYATKIVKGGAGAIASIFDIIDIGIASNALIECNKRADSNNPCSDKEIRDNIAAISFASVSFVSGVVLAAIGTGPAGVVVAAVIMIGHGIYNGISNIIEYNQYGTTSSEDMEIFFRSLLFMSPPRSVEHLAARIKYVNDTVSFAWEELNNLPDNIVAYAIGFGEVQFLNMPKYKKMILAGPVFCPPGLKNCTPDIIYYPAKVYSHHTMTVPTLKPAYAMIDLSQEDTSHVRGEFSRVLPNPIKDSNMICLPKVSEQEYELHKQHNLGFNILMCLNLPLCITTQVIERQEYYQARSTDEYIQMSRYDCNNAVVLEHALRMNLGFQNKSIVYNLNNVNKGKIFGSHKLNNIFLVFEGDTKIFGGTDSNEFIMFRDRYNGSIYLNNSANDIIDVSKLSSDVISMEYDNQYMIITTDTGVFRINELKNTKIKYVGRKHKVDKIICKQLFQQEDGNQDNIVSNNDIIIINSGGGEGYFSYGQDQIQNCSKVVVLPNTVVQGSNGNYTIYIQSLDYAKNYSASYATSEIDIAGRGTIVFPEISLLKDCNQIDYSAANNILSFNITLNGNSTYLLQLKNYLNKDHGTNYVLIDKYGSNIIIQYTTSNNNPIIRYFGLSAECNFDTLREVVNHYRNISSHKEDYIVYGTVKNTQYNNFFQFGSSECDIMIINKDVVYVEGNNGSDLYIIDDNSFYSISVNNKAKDLQLDILKLPVNNINNILLIEDTNNLHVLFNNNRDEVGDNRYKKDVQIDHYFQDNIYRHIALMDKNNNSYIPFKQSNVITLLPFYHASLEKNLFVLSSNSKNAVIDIDVDNIVLYKQDNNLLLVEKEKHAFNSLSIILKDYYLQKQQWSGIKLYSYTNGSYNLVDLKNTELSTIRYQDEYDSVIKEYVVDLTAKNHHIKYNQQKFNNAPFKEDNQERINIVIFQNMLVDSLEANKHNNDLILRNSMSNKTLTIKNWYNHTKYKISMFEFNAEEEQERIYISNDFVHKIKFNKRLSNEILNIDNKTVSAVISYLISSCDKQDIFVKGLTYSFLENERNRLSSNNLSVEEIIKDINSSNDTSGKALLLLAAKAHNKLLLKYDFLEKEYILQNSCFNTILSSSRIKEMIECINTHTNFMRFEQFIDNNKNEIQNIITKLATSHVGLDNHHKHRHHHREDNRGGYHSDDKHVSGQYRERRDIENERKIVSDNAAAMFESQDNIEVMSSSSAGSSAKPIGYSMVNWIRDNLSKLKYLFNHVEKEIVFNSDDNVTKKEILDIAVSDNQFDQYNYVGGLNHVIASDSVSRLVYEARQQIGNAAHNNKILGYTAFDTNATLMLINIVVRKFTGVKDSQSLVLNQDVSIDTNTREYAQSIAYNAYVPRAAENEGDIDLLGVS